jgi:hypothetical protein
MALFENARTASASADGPHGAHEDRASSRNALIQLKHARSMLEAGQPPRTHALTLVDAAAVLLEHATGVEEVKDATDTAGALVTLLKKRHENLIVTNLMTEQWIKGERRLGELLRDVVKRGSHKARLPKGITADLSSRCQRLADIPEDKFERIIAEMRSEKELSTAAVLRRAAPPHSSRPHREEHSHRTLPRTAPLTRWESSQEGEVVPLAYNIRLKDLRRRFRGIVEAVDGTITAVVVRRHERNNPHGLDLPGGQRQSRSTRPATRPSGSEPSRPVREGGAMPWPMIP